MINYSKTLFDIIYKKIEQSIENIQPLNFNGIWCFLYHEGANSLKSCYYKDSREDGIETNDKDDINDAFVNCDDGSLGFAFEELKNNKTETISYLANTFNDPRGVVCVLDSQIDQQHAVFLFIKQKNVSNQKSEEYDSLGIIDIFFSGNGISDQELNEKIEASELKKLISEEDFITLCQSAFIIQRYEQVFENEINTDKTIEKVINRIENILSLYSETPIFQIEKENYSEKFVGINYDYIHSTIKYQYRYCSLIENKNDCPHYCFQENSKISCSNPFLQKYFYDILKNLGVELYQYDNLSFADNSYTIKYWAKEKLVESVFTQLNYNEIQNNVENFINKYPSNETIAINKFKDEILFDFLKKELKDITVLAIERTFNPHLTSTSFCEIQKKREEISPSRLSALLHIEEEPDGQHFKTNSIKNNTVHIDILAETEFKLNLKAAIAKYPECYFENIKTYLKSNESNLKSINGLNFRFVGNDPFYNELIKGQLNEQILQIDTIIGRKETEQHAIRAAISQVMARNMSHNIGSHVMNNLIGELNNIPICSLRNYLPKFGFDNIYHNIFANDNICTKGEEICIQNQNEILLKQIATYNNYVKCRMDYLADIALSTPVMQTTKTVYTDVFKEFDKVRLLLNYISGLNTNFKFEVQICNSGYKIENATNDVAIAFPNDLLGSQAFYNIIENVIRNTAKHATNKDEITTFTINIREIEDDEIKNCDDINVINESQIHYCVEIYDNIDLTKEFEINEFGEISMCGNNPNVINRKPKAIKKGENRELDDYFSIIALDENYEIPYADWLIFQQNSKINESILNSESKVRSSSLGLIEMDASAAYLRKLPLENIDSSEYNVIQGNGKEKIHNNKHLHILKAFLKEDGDKRFLAYRFFILKPQEVLIVSNKIDEIKIKDLKKKGVWVENEDEFTQNLNTGKVYNHQFVVYTTNAITEVINVTEPLIIGDAEYHLKKHITQLPLRIIQCDENSVNELITETEKVVDKVWIKWWEDKKLNYTILNGVGESEEENKKETTELLAKFGLELIESKPTESIVMLNHIFDVKGQIDQSAKTKIEDIHNTQYIDALSSAAQSKLPGYNLLCGNGNELNNYLKAISEEEKNKHLKYELVESALTKIIVIDERVQLASKENNLQSVKFKDMYRSTNIIIPEVDLTKSSLSEADLSFLANETDNSAILLIHYGILERIFKNVDKINNYLITELSPQFINIVITTGRGYPKELTKNVRFISLSPILSALVEIRSKYLTHYILNQSRKN